MVSVREALPSFNPWWNGSWELDYRDRGVYAELRKFDAFPQALALTGLRRVGKTTLLRKYILDEIDSGLAPERALYFSFDEHREVPLRDILRAYEELRGQDLREGRHLVVFDEVQKVRGWSDQLKALYDLHHKRVRFLLSGSESLFLRRDIHEGLAGRLFDFRVSPLSFREYLHFLGKPAGPVDLRSGELSRAFEAYGRCLGLPELVTIPTLERAHVSKYVRDHLVDRVLYRDLHLILGRVNEPLLESLLNLVTEEPGQVLLLPSLAQELGASRQTIARLLWYLESSFLLRKLYNFSPSRRKSERKLKRYYPVLPSPTLLFQPDSLSQSRIFENVVVNALMAEFFWLDPYRHEVDVVLGRPSPVPIEVKYGSVETAGLERFMERFHVKRGYVVSREKEEERKVPAGTIAIVPVYKFLLDPPGVD